MTAGYLVPMELPNLDAALRDTASETAEVRWVAALALAGAEGGRRGEALRALERLCGDPVEEVRAQALEGLAEQLRAGADAPRALVLAGLDDAAAAVRCAALDAADVFLDEAPAAAIRGLADREPAVRAVAARLAGELGDAAAARRLVPLLEDQDRVVRDEAALALVRIGDERGEHRVRALLEGNEIQAVEAAQALGELGRPASSAALARVATAWLSSPELKALAAAALCRCGDPAGLVILKRVLGSRRENARLAALGALARLPVPGIAAAVGACLERGSELEASAALRTLSTLSTVDRPAAVQELYARKGVLRGALADELAEALALPTPEDR